VTDGRTDGLGATLNAVSYREGCIKAATHTVELVGNPGCELVAN